MTWKKDKRRETSYGVEAYFLGTFDLLNGIAKVLGTDKEPKPYTAVAKLRFQSRPELKTLYDFMYYTDAPCLKRKKVKFEEIFGLPFLKRGGRPKGSKNKKKELAEKLEIGVEG